eukprot:jgi/Chrpa1/17682/Chrysochromulina_OHIO_Genome00020352-RA
MLTLNVSVSTVSADDDSVGIEMSGRFNYHSSETEGSSRADGAEGGARPAKSGVIGRLGSDPNHTPTVTESPRTNQDMVRQQKEEAMVISEGATVVHQPPWKGSSACSDPDFFIGTDSHDKGEHQLGDHVLHKEGAVGGGHGLGNGGGRVSSAGCRVSVGSGGASGNNGGAQLQAPNCNDPDAPRFWLYHDPLANNGGALAHAGPPSKGGGGGRGGRLEADITNCYSEYEAELDA